MITASDQEVLHLRWLGRVPYEEGLAVQRSLFSHGTGNHLLLLEHDHVFTYGRHADLDTNLRCDPDAVGAQLVAVDRGGDITYHGPGQLVGYPIVSLADGKRSLDHVRAVEQVVIDALVDLGVPSPGRLDDFPGVWVGTDGPEPRKIASIGVRLSRGRTMHGFGLNVSTDMTWMRDHIIACGIADRPVTSIHEEGIEATMAEVVNLIAVHAAKRWGRIERQDVAWRMTPTDLAPFSRGAGPGEAVVFRPRSHRRLEAAGVTDGFAVETRKPDWLRPRVKLRPEVTSLGKTMRELDLVTVCEDAGCPNRSECWSAGTATFMVLGERCTRACGFCLVDTRKPLAPDPDEPRRVAEAVNRLHLGYAVLTMVSRDDLDDGGMAHVADCVTAIRTGRPNTAVETLISDAGGNRDALDRLFAVRPDVINHNVETVPRLQRAVRPSANYARSLSVLAWAKEAGLVTKTSVMVGLGETDAEIKGVLADLADLGCDIVTIGHYLRPTSHHLPIARWVEPEEFSAWKRWGEARGIPHIEASPLTRSSYHAGDAMAHVAQVSIGGHRTPATSGQR